MSDKELIDKLNNIEVKLVRIEEKIDDYKEVKDTSSKALAKSVQNEKDIFEIQDKIKWITRAIVGAIISGTIALLYFK